MASALLLFQLAATAQNGSFTMVRPSDGAAQPFIIGGRKAIPSQWPATFVFRDPAGGSCTSTAIGDRVLLTAAHCIDHKATGIVKIHGNAIAVTCYHHPDYHSDVANDDPQWAEKVSPDFALCLAESPLETVSEVVDIEGKHLAEGNVVHLLGYGCNEQGGSDGGFGVLYEGEAGIEDLPSGANYYLTTTTGAAVCYGDSGGGAYVFLNPARTRRIAIGVNSRGDIAKISLISTTSVLGFRQWAIALANQHGVTICGLHAQDSSCRPL